ncbi:hypothetical protein MMC08_009162 [Hypocenomyce scalaris]|nr:hypothetical protein [Hypocenomyce scalaris]
MKMVKTTGAKEEGVKKSDSGVKALPTSLDRRHFAPAEQVPEPAVVVDEMLDPHQLALAADVDLVVRHRRSFSTRPVAHLSCPFLQQRDVVEVMLIGAKDEGPFGVWEICASESVANAIGVDVEGLSFSTSEE